MPLQPHRSIQVFSFFKAGLKSWARNLKDSEEEKLQLSLLALGSIKQQHHMCGQERHFGKLWNL